MIDCLDLKYLVQVAHVRKVKQRVAARAARFQVSERTQPSFYGIGKEGVKVSGADG